MFLWQSQKRTQKTFRPQGRQRYLMGQQGICSRNANKLLKKSQKGNFNAIIFHLPKINWVLPQ